MTPVQQALADTTNAEIDVVVDRLVSFPDGADKETALASVEKCRIAALAAIDHTVDQPDVVVEPEAAVVEPEQQNELPPEGPHADVAPSETAPSSPHAPESLQNEGTSGVEPGDEASPTADSIDPQPDATSTGAGCTATGATGLSVIYTPPAE